MLKIVDIGIFGGNRSLIMNRIHFTYIFQQIFSALERVKLNLKAFLADLIKRLICGEFARNLPD